MEKTKILAVDDAKDTLLLLEFDLNAEGYEVVLAESGEQAMKILKEQQISLVLLDIYMPGLSGLETLMLIKQSSNTANLPVIMLSSSDDSNEIVAALELGAADYVTKPYLAKVLLARIRTALRLVQKTEALAKLAQTDFLTGINNRANFESLTSIAVSQANREIQPLSFAMIDIDFFKKVNDTYGHEAGDQVLKEFADNLKQQVRDYDIIGRIGGEEFAICMPCTKVEHARFACERIREHVENSVIALTNDNSSISITISIGLTSVVNVQANVETLMRVADNALYEAKSQGRNRVITLPYVDDDDDNGTNTNEIRSNVMNETEAESDSPYPGIDYQVGVNNVLGDDALFKEILTMFYQDHGNDKEKIAQALAQQDIFSAKNLVHTLKGVSSSIGAMELFESTKQLDIAINEQRSNEYDERFEAMANDLDKLVSGLKKRLIDNVT